MFIEKTVLGFNDSILFLGLAFLLTFLLMMAVSDTKRFKAFRLKLGKDDSTLSYIAWHIGPATLMAMITAIVLTFVYDNSYEKFEEMKVALFELEEETFEPIKVKLNREKQQSEDPSFNEGAMSIKEQVQETRSVYRAEELFYAEIEYNDGFEDTTVVYKGYVKLAESNTDKTYFGYKTVSGQMSKHFKVEEGTYLPTIYLAKKDKD